MIIKRKLGPKGQLIIPKDIRKLLGVSQEKIFL
jgi:bifunctional DNA-binding transcriptional regulator/antitoxin component of YhaV-PrlF toxin-antitoxin module